MAIKPEQFEFVKVSRVRGSQVKDHGRKLFKRAELLKQLNSDDEEFVSIDSVYLDQNSYEVTFIKRVERDREVYAREMAEYELTEKLTATQREINTKLHILDSLKTPRRKVEELRVAKYRLAEFTGNQKIPPERKKELVSKWTIIVNRLQSGMDPEEQELLNKLSDQISKLQEDLELQKEILNLNPRQEIRERRSFEDEEDMD